MKINVLVVPQMVARGSLNEVTEAIGLIAATDLLSRAFYQSMADRKRQGEDKEIFLIKRYGERGAFQRAVRARRQALKSLAPRGKVT